MRKNILVILLVVVIFVDVHAQNSLKTDTTFCVPRVLGVPRAKGLVIKHETLLDYSIKSKNEDTGLISESQIRRNSRLELKLKFPVVRKEEFKMVVGARYFSEEFYFENPNSLISPFYKNLEDRALKSIRGDLLIVKPTQSSRFYILRLSAGFNGDYNSEKFGEDKSEFLKYSIASLMGWKKNDYLSYAVGLSFGYTFGNRSLIPIFSYNKTFNQHWGVESILPSNAKLRYNTLDKKNYFYLSTELKGANYSVGLSDDQVNLMFLDKSEMRMLIIWEREIHDWLWLGVEGGYRKNISFDLADSPRIGSNIILDNSLKDAVVFNFSLFIVPPRKFFD